MRFLVALAVFTLIVGALMALYARRVLAPLRVVTERATAVAAGDLTPRPLVASSDEIGELATTFESMVSAIARANAELLAAERLATIGKMAAHVTHEIRNPLSSLALERRASRRGARRRFRGESAPSRGEERGRPSDGAERTVPVRRAKEAAARRERGHRAGLSRRARFHACGSPATRHRRRPDRRARPSFGERRRGSDPSGSLQLAPQRSRSDVRRRTHPARRARELPTASRSPSTTREAASIQRHASGYSSRSSPPRATAPASASSSRARSSRRTEAGSAPSHAPRRALDSRCFCHPRRHRGRNTRRPKRIRSAEEPTATG